MGQPQLPYQAQQISALCGMRCHYGSVDQARHVGPHAWSKHTYFPVLYPVDTYGCYDGNVFKDAG